MTETIRASIGLDTKPLIEGLKESKRQASDFKSALGKDTFGQVVKGVTASKDATQGLGAAMGGLTGGLKAAGTSAIALYALKEILTRAAQAGKQSRDQVLGLERETHKLVRTSDFSTAAEGVDDLTGKYRGLGREVRRLRDAESGFSETRHPILGPLRHLGEQLRGRESIFGGPSESEIKLSRASAAIGERRARIATIITDAAKDEYDVTRATVQEDEIQGRIKQEQLQTEARIAKLRKAEFGPDVIEPIKRASELRIQTLRAQESFQKLDIAAAFQKAQLERPGIGLTAPEVQGAQLFRQRADIQQRLGIEPSAVGRARLGVEADVNRNQIEEAEFQQFRRGGAKSGRGTSQGGQFRSATEGMKAHARYRERIQDMIRNNPELRDALDTGIGAPFAFGAPRQTQLMPVTPPASSPAEQHDISGGRSLNDIYQLIDKKWQ